LLLHMFQELVGTGIPYFVCFRSQYE